MGSQTACQVPVIDFTDESLKPATDTWVSACKAIRSALEDHGCFYALCEVPMELCSSVFVVIEQVFDLPLETKTQKISDKPFHGYYGQSPQFPLYESLGIDDPLTLESVQKFARTMWPQGYDQFCETINKYANLVVELDRISKRMVFEAFGVEQRLCDSLLESTNYMLRSFKYRLPQKPEPALGLYSHTDTTFLSILHQNDVVGLQIKLKNGEWIDANPSPSMFLVLAGDAFKVWSNDRIRSCEHRVIISAKKERCSMGLFSFGSKLVQTHEDFVDEEHPRLYKPFDHYEYIQFHGSAKLIKPECRIKAFCGIDYARQK